ncbi:MAG: hypothetical protein MHPSP_002255, partial [Paramarteilia canceri]
RINSINSPLNEFAALGFEYGYSLAKSNDLVIWEAQFGDFVNCAQVIIDNYLSACFGKWGISSSLVLQLPHGYEGQGPEHSSARVERFLQLSDDPTDYKLVEEDDENIFYNSNLIVTYPSLPASYFHFLRRQISMQNKRPLIILTPKSMLRNPDATSPVSDFSAKLPLVISFDENNEAEKIILCSGKILYDIKKHISENNLKKKADFSLFTLEQICPFPQKELNTILKSHHNLKKIVWVQEEPRNMGFWNFIKPRLDFLVGDREIKVEFIGRDPCDSPAT